MVMTKILFAIIIYHFFDRVLCDVDKNITENDTASSGYEENVFDGVYSECLLKLSYTCLQKKTLLYLRSLNRLSEVSIFGDYVKFVKINGTETKDENIYSENPEELSYVIDMAVNNFFENHLIRFSALGKDVLMPNTVEKFVGRKKRKGGGGGGGHGGGDDGGKKKMFMMAMMCMKMKMMMMVPAMMGMMGMMSFKGMMFSMMSFMVSKMMLLMKLLEKKGGAGGGAGWNAAGDGGWAASGGGGTWMPTGTCSKKISVADKLPNAYGTDYGSGGYDSNGQWQSRSILERLKDDKIKPKLSFKPIQYLKLDPYESDKPKSRRKRGLIDTFHSAYMYWMSKFLGGRYIPKYKVVNGIKYVYQPNRGNKRGPKVIKNPKPIITEDFNKGEIVEGPVEGRMTRRKISKMKENVKEAVDENPWE